jgi:hypothetical protein
LSMQAKILRESPLRVLRKRSKCERT